MSFISYNNLVDRFGEVIAWYYLTEIEKATYKKALSLSISDPETRLANALRAQDALFSQMNAKAA